jgi:hypothetical protein
MPDPAIEPPFISALYVERDGAYYGLDNVDPWDETRDARRYRGPWPVVAHPPCNTWCQLASVNQTRWGKMIGDDGGTFAAALDSVRRWGGVLEHPAYSIAWSRYELPVPSRHGWTQAIGDPGISTEIFQAAYGHGAAKRTWLYAVGVDPIALDWRRVRGAGVIGGGINTGECMGRPKLERAIATPDAFRDVLVALARTVPPPYTVWDMEADGDQG